MTATPGTDAADPADTVPPSVGIASISVTFAGGALRTGQTATFDLTPTQALAVSGSPTLLLSNGAIATYVASGSTSTDLRFSYTVAPGQDTSDLQVSGLALNGATIIDSSVLGFSAPTPFGTTDNILGITTADLNGDGILDAIIPLSSGDDLGGSVGVLLGDGHGGFGPETTYATGGTVNAFVTTADLNHDGIPDLIVADQNGGISVLLGTGGGAFAAPSITMAGPTPHSIAVADLNHDGNPDLVVADLNGSVSVLLGDGNGGFRFPISFSAGDSPSSVAIADVDGDGVPDLIVADYSLSGANPGVAVLPGRGGGFFGAPTFYAAGPAPTVLAIADLNHDGRTDVVVVNNNGQVDVLLGTAGGGFAPAVAYDAGPYPTSVSIADVNGDGTLDLVVGFQGPLDNGGVSVLLGDGRGGFAPALTYDAGTPGFVTTADLDHDGKIDLLVSQQAGPAALDVLLNQSLPPLSFNPASTATATGSDTAIVVDTTAVTADTVSPAGPVGVGAMLDLTLAVSNPVTVTGTPTLDLGSYGTASYSATLSTPTSLVFTYVVPAGASTTTQGDLTVNALNLPAGASILDANGNTPDLTAVATDFSALVIDTTQPTVTGVTVSAGAGALGVGAVLTLGVTLSTAVSVTGPGPMLSLNDGGFASYDPALSTANTLVFTTTVTPGEFADTLAVIGAITPAGTTVTDAYGNPADLSGADITFVGLSVGAVSGDFSDDGMSDLLEQNTNGQSIIYVDNGLSVIDAISIGNPGPTWHLLGSADFNGDGQPDLLFQNDNGSIVDYLMNGTQISAGYNLGNPGSAWHVRGFGDFNGDSRADLLMQNDNGSLVILETNGTNLVGSALVGTLPPGAGIEAVADFNGDGQPDILVQTADGTLIDFTMQRTGIAAGNVIGNPGPGFFVAGTGDYNGDGKADILLHNDNGTNVIWVMNGPLVTSAVYAGNPGAGYTTAVTGVDLDGNGNSDLVVQNSTTSTLVGYTLNNTVNLTAGAVLGTPGSGWNVIGSNPITFLDGTGGNLALTGTPGPDQFVLTAVQAGIHTLAGFDPAQDTIALDLGAFPTFATVQANEAAYNGGTFINLGPTAAIVIPNVTPDQLGSGNFVLR